MKHRVPCFVLSILAIGVVPSLHGETPSAERPGRRYALLVGVHEYGEGQPLPALRYAEADAERLGDVLKQGGYAVTVMTQSVGGQKGQFDCLPLADHIRAKLSGILGSPYLKEQDTVLLAFAGHGVSLRIREGGQIVERFFFCPMNADVRPVLQAAEEEQFFTLEDLRTQFHLISIDELYKQLGESCSAGLKILLVDACRNDPSRSAGTRAIASVTLPPLPAPPGGIAAFFSCAAHQKAQEDPQLKHGVFFHYVIEGLGGKADFSSDRTVTLAELNEYVGSNVYDFVYRKYKSKQTPELRGQIRGQAPLLTVRTIRPTGGQTVRGSGRNNPRSPAQDATHVTSPMSDGEEASQRGELFQIEFTTRLPKRGRGYIYEFEMKVKPGDRLRFQVQPVRGAKLPTAIRVLKPDRKGNAFANVKKADQHNWTMPDGYPAERMPVQVIGYGVGKVEVRVTK